MQTFILNEQLQRDCHVLGYLSDTRVLLHRNALFRWFILLPNTGETEFHKLSETQQQQHLQYINRLSLFIEENFITDKLNIATIGNVVSQLHIHVVGRRKNDACWPDVVWGCKQSQAYTEDEVTTIRRKLIQALGVDFRADG